MATAYRAVKDIEPDKRRWLESVLGEPLGDDQFVVVRVLKAFEPDPATRARAFGRALAIAQEAQANVAASGMSEAELGAVIDEAVAHVRREMRAEREEQADVSSDPP